MAGIKITELTELSGAAAADSDVLVIVDVSANQTKKITFNNLIASNIDSADHSRSSLVSDLAKTLRASTSADNSFTNYLLFKPSSSLDDSVHYDSGFSVNPFTNRIRADGGFDGVADSALFADQAAVADSANFNLSSINDVSLSTLLTGQVLKWSGTAWENQNDNAGGGGAGSIASQINTKTETTDASFFIPFVGAVGADSVGVDAQLTYNPVTNILTATVSGADSATRAGTAINVRADSVAGSGTYYVLMRGDKDPGDDSVNSSVNFSWEASTNTLSATNFNGDGSSLSNVAALTATNATNVAITGDSTDATYYFHFGSALSGNDGVNVNNNITVNPNSGSISYLDTTARIAMGADSDFVIDTTGVQYSFNVTNNGASAYTYSDTNNVFFPTSEDNPVLYLRRGETYRFDMNASGHPFEIRVSNGGAAYNTGVTNNGVEGGAIFFAVPMSAPSTLYYQCTIHSGMGNTINIV
jgi:hypothetical protein